MADDVISFEDAAKFAKPPFSTKPTKTKKPPSWEVKPELHPPADFPESAAKILRKNKISRKQFNRYAEQFTLFLLTNMSADFAVQMQRGLRLGSTKHMEIFAKLTGLMKNDSGVVVNLNSNNTTNNTISVDRGFESIVRKLDARDREARIEQSITVQAIEAGAVDGDMEAR